MSRLLSVLCLLILAANSSAQEQAVDITIKPSSEGKSAAVCHTPSEGRWLVLTDKLLPVQAESFLLKNGGSVLFWEGDPGSYGVIFIPNDIAEGLAARQVKLGHGPQPPPDPDDPDVPDPPDPDQPTSGLVWITVIRENAELTADQAQTLIKLRTWSDKQPADKIAHWEFSPDAGTENANVQAYIDKIPASGKLPWLFVSQRKKGDSGAVILHSGPLPASADEIIAIAGRVAK